MKGQSTVMTRMILDLKEATWGIGASINSKQYDAENVCVNLKLTNEEKSFMNYSSNMANELERNSKMFGNSKL